MGNKVTYKNYLILGTILLILVSGCDRPKLTGMDFENIDTSQDPLQITLPSTEPFIMKVKNGLFTLTPMAEYKVSGMVVGRKTYSEGWEAKLSPIDLAIVWGNLAEPGYDRSVHYSQSHRWYFYRFKEGSPLNNAYIISHSSNHHLIPANENIRRALKMIAKKDKIVLEGFLVNVKGTYKGQSVFWNTSLSRMDKGQGACELFYVMKARIETKVYE
jgi:hypothetical protein